MSEEKNRDSSGWQERREQRMRRRTQYRSNNYQRREERMARMKAFHERRYQGQEFHDKREWFGIFIIIVGLIWLAKAFMVSYPVWLYSWQTLMIGAGLTIGLSSGFRNKSAYIVILIGLTFFARDYIFPDRNLGPYIWPLIVIAIGVIFLLKKRSEDRFRKFVKEHPQEVKDWRHYWHCGPQDPDIPHQGPKKSTPDATNVPDKASYPTEVGQSGTKFEEYAQNTDEEHFEDRLNVNAVFSGAKRNIWSKNFKGGEVVSIFGGADIDLSRADISGKITLDITVIMGGVKLAVPPNWQLKFSETCIMGGTNDGRRSHEGQDPNKTLIITGTIMMGGLEVRDLL